MALKYVILIFILCYNSASAILKIQTENKPLTVENDISSGIVQDKSMIVYLDNISNNENTNEAVATGNIFGGAKAGIFNSDSIIGDKQNSIFLLKKNVRIRTNQNILIYADSLQTNKKEDTAEIDNAHIIFNNNANLLASKFKKTGEDKYEAEGTIFSLCQLKNMSSIDLERQRCGKDYEKTHNISVPSAFTTFSNDNTYDDVKKEYKETSWNVSAKKMSIDTKENVVTMEDMSIKFQDFTVFHKSHFKHKIVKSRDGQSGFLPPEISMVKSQLGIGLPFYWRINTNTDLVLTPTLYVSRNALLGKKDTKGITKDSKRIREPNLGVQFRHLFYEENENRDEGKFELDGFFTRRTKMIDESGTRHYMTDENGRILYGNRYKADMKVDFGINKDTFVKGRWLSVSDINVLPIYEMDYRIFNKNYLGLYKSNEFSYNSAEILQLNPMLLNVYGGTNPKLIPQIKSIFEKRIDNIIGGRTLIEQRAVSLNRDSGYTTNMYNAKAGYIVPIKTKSGGYIKLSGIYNFDHRKSSFEKAKNDLDGKIDTSILYSSSGQDFYSAEDNRLMYYGFLNNQDLSGRKSRGYYNASIDLSKPFFKDGGSFGQFVIEPRMSYKQSPHTIASNMAMEDSLGIELQTSNLYSNNMSDGYSLAETGKRVSYGFDVHGALGFWDLRFLSSSGMMRYMSGKSALLSYYNGFGGDLSDYVGKIKLYNNLFQFDYEYRVSSTGFLNGMKSSLEPTYKSARLTSNITKKAKLTVDYKTVSLVPFGDTGTIKTISPMVSYRFGNDIDIGFMLYMIDQQSGSGIGDGKVTLSKGISLTKHSSCFFYGFKYIERAYLTPGLSPAPVIRLQIGITGI